mmetsp:Transcript_31532/g.100551  ORF Transcript_31532/g.100551 Transcript_31532/m.100551 type:complete len:238 (-) Transcript_31532:1817-2530(-)
MTLCGACSITRTPGSIRPAGRAHPRPSPRTAARGGGGLLPRPPGRTLSTSTLRPIRGRATIPSPRRPRGCRRWTGPRTSPQPRTRCTTTCLGRGPRSSGPCPPAVGPMATWRRGSRAWRGCQVPSPSSCSASRPLRSTHRARRRLPCSSRPERARESSIWKARSPPWRPRWMGRAMRQPKRTAAPRRAPRPRRRAGRACCTWRRWCRTNSARSWWTRRPATSRPRPSARRTASGRPA